MFQEIAEYLPKRDIDNLRLVVDVALPNRQWLVNHQPIGDEGYLRLVRTIITHHIDFDMPLITSLDTMFASIDCISRHKNLTHLDLRGNAYATSFELPLLEKLVAYEVTTECLNRHKKLRHLEIVGCTEHTEFELPLLEILHVHVISTECLNKHVNLKQLECWKLDDDAVDKLMLPHLEVLLLACTLPPSSDHLINRLSNLRVLDCQYCDTITSFTLPHLEELTSMHVTQECIDRHKTLKKLDVYFNVNHPESFDLPLLESLMSDSVSEECVNRHAMLRVLMVGENVTNFYLHQLTELHSNYATQECIDRHKTLTKLNISNSSHVVTFDLPLLEVLYAGSIDDECIRRHKKLRELSTHHRPDIPYENDLPCLRRYICDDDYDEWN